MDRHCCILLLCLLSNVWRGVAGELADPVLHKAGDDAVLRWNLPAANPVQIITVALQTPTQPQALFAGSTQGANMITTLEPYVGRIDVLDSLSVGTGLVTFTLKAVNASDAGHYICIEGVGNEPIIPDCGQMLVIVDKPLDTAIKVSGAAVEGEDLTLECVATSTSLPEDHNLPQQVQWFDSSGAQVTGGQDKVENQGTALVVRSIQRHDAGLKFSCRASDGLDMWSEPSQPYTIIPEYAPRKEDITMPRRNVVVDQGDSLQQDCSAVCNPDCTVTWERRQQQQGNWYTLDTLGGLLDIPNVQRDNVGRYRCRAKNDHGSSSRSLDVNVRYAPNLQSLHVNRQKTKKARMLEGQNVTIRCQFDSNPAPTVRWFSEKDKTLTLAVDDLADEKPVVTFGTAFPHATYTSEFVLSNVQCSDTSFYICSASNPLGSGLDGRLQLDVVCMPRNIHGEKGLQQLYLSPADQAFHITFQVEAYPRPDIFRIISEDAQGRRQLEVKGNSWTVNTMTESTHPFLTTFELRMPNLTPQYFDRTYYLEIENSEGKKTLAFLLRERGAPKPPRNLTAVWTDDSSVRLSWIPGFHGGKPQTFVVQYQDITKKDSFNQIWKSVPTKFQETQDESPKQMTLGGLQPGSSYNICVHALNEYGNSTSVTLTIATLATAASSADGGTIAGAVIAVIIVVAIVVLVLVYIFVIRPRRNKDDTKDDTGEPMLSDSDKQTGVATVAIADEKPLHSTPADTTNNNANADASVESPETAQTQPRDSPDNRNRNQDGLIYADLQLAKSRDSTPVPERKDAVNYDVIDFTRKAPETGPDDIEVVPVEEPLYANN